MFPKGSLAKKTLFCDMSVIEAKANKIACEKNYVTS